MNLPPLTLDHYAMDYLVHIGAISRLMAAKLGNPPKGVTPWAWVQKHGYAQTYDKTIVAIDQWVHLGASVADMLKASGGTCSPSRLAHAVKRWQAACREVSLPEGAVFIVGELLTTDPVFEDLDEICKEQGI